MPTITPADALICAADSLTDAIAGLVPTPTCAMDAVDQLMIFRQQARIANNAATAQRVLRECAQAERVIEEERQENEAPKPVQAQVTFSELEEPNDIPALPQGIPQITQDEYDNFNAPPHLTCDSNKKR
jgi:hypothetical protein